MLNINHRWSSWSDLSDLGPEQGQAAWIVNNLNGCTTACPSGMAGMGHGVPMDPQSWSSSPSHRFEVRHLKIPLCKFRNSWVQKKCYAKLQLLLSRSCPFWRRLSHQILRQEHAGRFELTHQSGLLPVPAGQGDFFSPGLFLGQLTGFLWDSMGIQCR